MNRILVIIAFCVFGGCGTLRQPSDTLRFSDAIAVGDVAQAHRREQGSWPSALDSLTASARSRPAPCALSGTLQPTALNPLSPDTLLIQFTLGQRHGALVVPSEGQALIVACWGDADPPQLDMHDECTGIGEPFGEDEQWEMVTLNEADLRTLERRFGTRLCQEAP